jgi:tRNA (guanine-N7-)-methyltransferase
MARRFPKFTSQYELSFPELPTDEHGTVLWSQVFGHERPLRIEIGVGNSSFLVEVARRAPDFNYLGFEYSRKRVLKFLKKVEEAGLSIVRVLPLNVSLILDFAFPSSSIDHFYINHPDPWPKRRHAKKRFVCAENARRLVRLLRPGGGISLRTDVPSYAAQMAEVLDANEGLLNLAGKGSFASKPIEPFTTAFEERFLAQGHPIYYLEYRKMDAEGPHG